MARVRQGAGMTSEPHRLCWGLTDGWLQMRLSDFDLTAGPGYAFKHTDEDGRAKTRTINRRAMVVSEEVRFELAAVRPIDAPFGKLVVEMAKPDAGVPTERRVEHLLNVVRVTVDVRESDLWAERSRRNAALLDTTEEALTLIAEGLGWESADLCAILGRLREKVTELGSIELDALSRLDRRTRRRARVFYVVADEGTAVDVHIEDADGTDVRHERVAESKAGFWLERFFPVRSAIMKHGAFILRDRKRQPLASVDV